MNLTMLYQESFFLKKITKNLPISDIAVLTFIITVILMTQIISLDIEYVNGMYHVIRGNEITLPIIFGGGFILFFEFIIIFYKVSQSVLGKYRFYILSYPAGLMIALFVMFFGDVIYNFPNYLYLIPLALGHFLFLIGLSQSPSILLFPPKSLDKLLNEAIIHPRDGIVLTTDKLDIKYINQNFTVETGYNYNVLGKKLFEVLEDPEIIYSDRNIYSIEKLMRKSSFKIEVFLTVKYNRRVVYELEKIYRKYFNDYTFIIRNVDYKELGKSKPDIRSRNVNNYELNLKKNAHDLRNASQYLEAALYILEDMQKKKSTNEMPIAKNMISFAQNMIVDISERIKRSVSDNKQILEKVKLNKFIEDIYQSIPTKNEIDVRLEIPNEQIYVNMDKKNLSNIISNIIINAVDALLSEESNREKRITIKLKIEDIYDIHGNKEAYAEIIIMNNGPKIADHIRDKMFEPYYTTKGKQGGSGLGLSGTNDILEYQNGYIDVRSNESLTTFTIYLPIVERAEV